MSTKKIQEELNLLSSYILPHASSYFTLDFDRLSNEQIKMVLSDWLPNQIIKIGSYYFYYLRKDISPELWTEDFIDDLSFFADEIACRKVLSIEYLNGAMTEDANLLILCFIKDEYLEDDFQRDLLTGVFISKYDSKNQDAFIYATCFQAIPEIKIKLGLFMRCLGLSLMKNLSVKHVYTEALNLDLVKYYSHLGFKIMNDTHKTHVKCNEKKKLEELHKIQKKFKDIDEIITYTQKSVYPKQVKKWYMSICNYDEKEICFTAFDSIRKELKKIPPSKSILASNFHTVKRFKLTKWRDIKFEPKWEEYFLQHANMEDIVAYLNLQLPDDLRGRTQEIINKYNELPESMKTKLNDRFFEFMN